MAVLGGVAPGPAAAEGGDCAGAAVRLDGGGEGAEETCERGIEGAGGLDEEEKYGAAFGESVGVVAATRSDVAAAGEAIEAAIRGRAALLQTDYAPA